MPGILKMSYRLIDTGGVVDQDVAQSGAGDSAVHGYQGHTIVDQRFDWFCINLRSDERNAIHPADEHSPDRLLNARGMEVRCGHQHLAVRSEERRVGKECR